MEVRLALVFFWDGTDKKLCSFFEVFINRVVLKCIL